MPLKYLTKYFLWMMSLTHCWCWCYICTLVKKKKKKTQSQLFMLVGEYTYETCLNIVYLYVKIGRNLLLMSYIWTKYTRLDRQKLCQIYHNGARCLINLAHLSGHVICFFFPYATSLMVHIFNKAGTLYNSSKPFPIF